MHLSIITITVIALLLPVINCGRVPFSGTAFRQSHSSHTPQVQVPVPIQQVCSDLFGKANAQQNFNDSNSFTLSAEYPGDISVYWGASRSPVKGQYFYPINLIATTYTYLGSGSVTAEDGYASFNDGDEEVTLVVAEGDFINTITVNYNTGSVQGSLGAVYGLTFYTFCNCSASVGWFDGSLNKNFSTGTTWALEYFAGTTAQDVNNKKYIQDIRFCQVKQNEPKCPANPCSGFSNTAEVTTDDTESVDTRLAIASPTVVRSPRSDDAAVSRDD